MEDSKVAPASRPDFERFRGAFPICERVSYFQSAYRGPLHRPALDALQRLQQDHAARGADARQGWFDYYPVVAQKLRAWHGAADGSLAFTPNCSWTIGAIAHGMDWREGDEILMPDNEFPANVYPWITAAERFGLRVRKVPVDDTGRVSAEMLLDAASERTRLITASHVNFATGYRIDIAGLCAEARRRGILTVIDAAQSVGWCAIDAALVGADALIGVARKFFCALDGLAWLIVSPSMIERLTLVAPGPFSVVHDKDYLNHEPTWRSDALRFTNGAVSTGDVFALGASLDLFCAAGDGQSVAQARAAIEGRCMALSRLLRAGLDERGVRYFGDQGTWSDAEHGATVVIRDVSDASARRWNDAGVSVSYRFGGARVSCHAFNTEAEVEHAVAVLVDSIR